MKFIYQTKSDFFKKVPGGYFAITGTIIFITFFSISIILHSLTDPVDWRRYFVSNMGIGPNGASIAFSIATFFQAILLYPLIIHLGQQLWMDKDQPHKQINNVILILAFIISMISIPGLIILSIFSMAPATMDIHGTGANIFFIGTILYGGAFWISFELNKKSTLGLRLCSFLVLSCFFSFIGSFVALIFQYPEEWAIFMANQQEYMKDILGNTTDTKLEYVRITEWLFVLGMVLWCLYLGYLSAKIAKKTKTK